MKISTDSTTEYNSVDTQARKSVVLTVLFHARLFGLKKEIDTGNFSQNLLATILQRKEVKIRHLTVKKNLLQSGKVIQMTTHSQG